MRTFIVKSFDGSHWLEFSGPAQHGATEYDDSTFTVSLCGDRVNARARVVDLDLSHWGDLFESMASEWRGWEGSKDEASLEGHLKLSCTADYSGHVRVRVTLRDDFDRSNWTAEQTILLEAGQLDALARDARAFFSDQKA